jgi:excisionase family DNA binding protein
MDQRLLYRVPEVAVILNISRSKVYELLGSGALPSVKRRSNPLGTRFRSAPIRRVAPSCGLTQPTEISTSKIPLT